MKNFKRAISFALCVTICMGAMSTAATGFWELPDKILRENTLQIGDGLFFTSDTLDHSVQGRQEEHFFTMQPNSKITPMVVNGPYIYNGGLTITDAGKKLQDSGHTVVGGITGDMFSTKNGIPLGLVVREGVLRTCDNDLSAVGFTAAGAIIGQPKLVITATYKDKFGRDVSFPISKINRLRDSGGIYLYTHDFAESTKTTLEGRHVAIDCDQDLAIGRIVGGKVKDISTGKDAYKLARGTVVLSASSQEQVDILGAIPDGAHVSISIQTADKRWESVTYACGGLNQLIKNGQPVTGHKNERAPRTAVGIKSDGSSVYYAVDGRQSGYSNGLSLNDVALRLKDMGCVQALELDGGGSTVVAMTNPGVNDFKVVNSPSDGRLRKSTGYIFFVNKTPPIYTTARLFLTQNNVNMLPHASYTFGVTGADDNWHPTTVPTYGYNWTHDAEFVGTLQAGTFNSLLPGKSNVTAELASAKGTATVNVLSEIDEIHLFRGENKITELNVSKGEVVSLTAKAMLNTFPVVSSAKSYVWSVIGDVGTITPDGVFTASNNESAKGQLVLTAGGKMFVLPVEIGTGATLVDDFETISSIFNTTSLNSSFKLTSEAARGYKAGRIEFHFVEGMEDIKHFADTSFTLPDGTKYLSFHIKGSPNTLDFNFADAQGNALKSVSVGGITDGYLLRTITLPENAKRLTGITIRTGGHVQGNVFIDQLVAMREYSNIILPPNVKLSDPDRVTMPGYLLFDATLHDNGGNPLQKSNIIAMLDGKPQNFDYNEATGELSVYLPEPQNDLHMFTIEAEDTFGNRTHTTKQLRYDRTESPNMLRDASGWAEPFLDYIDRLGVLPIRTEFGLRYCDRNKNLTRLEMFEMIIKLKDVDISLYANVEMPFTDVDQVPADKLGYLQAAYALGYLAGRTDGDGKLRIGVKDDILKQEFCVVVNKLLPKGYKQAQLTNKDASNISPYALIAMSTMVEMGLIVGNDKGELEPRSALHRDVAATILTKAFF